MSANRLSPVKLKNRHAFTLIELLVVVAIILVLASLLVPAVLIVKKKARRSSAIVEIRAIEGACRQYLSDYKKPPDLMVMLNPDPELISVSVEGVFANILKGINDTGNNAKQMQYMEFQHFDESGEPRNPWGGRYFVKFDTDFNNVITAGAGEPGDPPDGDLSKTVIVWTLNEDVEPGDDLYLLTSWK